jgi:hypothetical protein
LGNYPKKNDCNHFQIETKLMVPGRIEIRKIFFVLLFRIEILTHFQIEYKLKQNKVFLG